MKIEIRPKDSFGKASSAGRIYIEVRNLGIHIFPYKNQRQWGYLKEWYDGPLYSFGLGPLLLLCWSY